MPTARELLEQVDALMRRNRARGASSPPMEPVPASVAETVGTASPAAATDDDIPELTELALAAPGGDREPPRRQALARELATVPSENYPHPSDAALAISLDDIPELTEAVEEIEAPSMLDPAGDFDLGEPSVWMEPGHGEVSMLGEPWPEAGDPAAAVGADRLAGDERDPASGGEGRPGIAAVGILHLVPEFVDEDLVGGLPTDAAMLPDTLASAADRVVAEPPEGGAAPAAIAPGEAAKPSAASDQAVPFAADPQRWEMLAEAIRMQVLQRIDIFTETGLQEQLAARLQPIVDRASADLVTSINQHLGQLLRAYVAEAIEREIEQWRAGGR